MSGCRTFKFNLDRMLIPFVVALFLFGNAALPVTAKASAKQDGAPIVEGFALAINGERVKLDDPARSFEGRLYLPVARLAGVFGAWAAWNSDHEAVTIHTASGDKIVLSAGVPVVYFNETRYVMDAAPFVAEGRIYIPLRYAAELMQATVKWSADEQLAEINTVLPAQAKSLSIFKNEAETFTDEDFKLLAKITQVESGYESYEGQLAVANVILNRVKSSKFPNTIRDVIYSGKQFPPAHNGLLDKSVPNESVLRAVKDALNGKNNVEDAVYFFNPKYSKGSFWSGLDVITTIGVHRFAK